MEEALKDLEKIRQTGLFNMFMERRAILNYANENNMFSLVAYCGNDRDKYMELLEELGKKE